MAMGTKSTAESDMLIKYGFSSIWWPQP